MWYWNIININIYMSMKGIDCEFMYLCNYNDYVAHENVCWNYVWLVQRFFSQSCVSGYITCQWIDLTKWIGCRTNFFNCVRFWIRKYKYYVEHFPSIVFKELIRTTYSKIRCNAIQWMGSYFLRLYCIICLNQLC